MYASLQTVLLVVYSMHVVYKYSYVVTVGIATEYFYKSYSVKLFYTFTNQM